MLQDNSIGLNYYIILKTSTFICLLLLEHSGILGVILILFCKPPISCMLGLLLRNAYVQGSLQVEDGCHTTVAVANVAARSMCIPTMQNASGQEAGMVVVLL